MGTAVRVLCTGGEGCGTNLMTRLVGEMGGEGIHLSFPDDGNWPTVPDHDAAIVMVRDWWAASASQEASGYIRSRAVGLDLNLPRAYDEISTQLRDKPWRMVSYESLVARPEVVLRNVAGWLGLDHTKVTEEVRDENAKWLR